MPLTPRERVIAALQLEEPDRTPLFELLADPPIIEAVTGSPLHPRTSIYAFPILKDREKIIQGNFERAFRCYASVGLDMAGAYMHVGPGYVPCRWIDNDTFIDEWGARWRFTREKDGYETCTYIGGTVESAYELESFRIPDPNAPGRTVGLEYALRKYRDRLLVAAVQNDVLSLSWRLLGLEKFLILTYRNLSIIERFMDQVTRFATEIAKVAVEAGAEVVVLGDDYGDSNGPFLHPDRMRRLVFPKLKIIVDSLKKRGAFVLKHCDGNLQPIMNDFITTGIDALHPITPMDIKEVKEQYGGELCLAGNIDCVSTLSWKKPEEVAQEVRECIRSVSPGGGHLLSSSNSITSSTRVENWIAMVETARKYGSYPIDRL
jgi:uroporphyrinogen decarboxylase